MIYYGHARLTADIDFFYDIASENTVALYKALEEFWGGDIPEMSRVEELQEGAGSYYSIWSSPE